MNDVDGHALGTLATAVSEDLFDQPATVDTRVVDFEAALGIPFDRQQQPVVCLICAHDALL
jgi:hypothetical protein